MNGDGLVKSRQGRHPGESRGPEIFYWLIPPLAGLDSGFHRNDENGLSATHYKFINTLRFQYPINQYWG